MEQLVGRNCIFCEKRFSWEKGARFCNGCGSPVHDKCSTEALARATNGSCAACGAPPVVIEALIQEHRKREAIVRSHAGMTTIVLGFVWLLGGAVATAMCSGLALGSGAGRVIVATGAISIGISLIVRGVIQSRRG